MYSLQELLKGTIYEKNEGLENIKISGITSNSRKVKEGDLFVCISGTSDDGHNHALEAEMLGAVAIICERETDSGLKSVKVTNSRQIYSILCQNFFKNPKNDLTIVTVVGTNGKTTTSYILDYILQNAGFKTGVIGTNGCKIGDELIESDLTTPDSFDLNRILRKMVSRGVEIAIIEASAHAISQDRLYGLTSDISIFTNISQDHLDYFCTFQRYFDTKLSFFLNGQTKSAIVNADDKLGQTILQQAKIPMISYGICEPSDVFAIDIEEKKKGTKFIINLFDELYEIHTPLYGTHNVYNVLGAVTLAKMLKVATPSIAQSLQKLPQISGRFNIFLYKNAKIIVDFAHTPDGLLNILKTSRPLSRGKLVVLFGCGGDRDKDKRAKMGKIAEEYSDQIILTEDNSRSEDTKNIIDDIMSGIKNTSKVKIVLDRKDAISYGISMLDDFDVLLVLGKGCEKYIEKKGRRTKFCDIDFVRSKCLGD